MQFNLAVKNLWLDVPRIRLVVDNVIKSALQKCNQSCALNIVVALDEGSQNLKFEFHLHVLSKQIAEELYGVPRLRQQEEPSKLLNSENFDLEAMLIERAVALLNGEIIKEKPEKGQYRVIIEVPLLQRPDTVI